MTRAPGFRPVLLLPLVAAGVAAALCWGGHSLARQERLERVEREDRAVDVFAEAAQRRLDSLAADYEEHLRRLCRTDLNQHFAPRDAMDGIVGVVQLSTLNPDGRVEQHLLASDVALPAAEIPLPVFDENALPPGRRRFALVGGQESFRPRQWFHDGYNGWLKTPEALFFHTQISARRAVLVLIDPAAVDAAVAVSLADWAGESLAAGFGGAGADALVAGGAVLASVGETPPGLPDATFKLRHRFGDWELRSWDPRHRVVEYRRERLAAAAALALLVLFAGGAASFQLHRALRLAERRVSFVNRVSHELKTPLTNILLNADLAADGASPAGRKRLGMVQEEVRRLARLIDNVLAFSRKERPPTELRPRPAALRPLVAEGLAQFRPALERRGLRLENAVSEELSAMVDPDAFAQILGNLVSNVEKYAAGGGLLRVEAAEIGVGEKGGGEVALRVVDRGPGIPAAERERVFQPFHRLDDRTAEGASGTGLGLGIARDLAERLGGSLRLFGDEERDHGEHGEQAEGAEGEARGAVFELRLPAAEAAGTDSDKLVAFPDTRAS